MYCFMSKYSENAVMLFSVTDLQFNSIRVRDEAHFLKKEK